MGAWCCEAMLRSLEGRRSWADMCVRRRWATEAVVARRSHSQREGGMGGNTSERASPSADAESTQLSGDSGQGELERHARADQHDREETESKQQRRTGRGQVEQTDSQTDRRQSQMAVGGRGGG
jgi:hypothetical protein